MNVGLIGIGSVLMGDDALGPYVVRTLEAVYEFPPEVQVLDLGTPGPELIHIMGEFDALIVVDTVRAQGEPGELKLYRKEEILEKPPDLRLSPHDPNLREAMLTADLAQQCPAEVLLIGVIPAEVELQTGLTAKLQSTLPRIEAAVIEELSRLGINPEPRAEPEKPDIWWEPDAKS